MNKYLIPTCWLVLLCGPGVSICLNQQINRLTIAAAFILIAGKLHSIKLALHHILFLCWLGWAALGCFYSDYPDLAFYGFYPYRGEGLLTWIVITCIAFLYWQNFTGLRPLMWMSAIGMTLFLLARFLIIHPHKEEFLAKLFLPDVGLGSFIAEGSLLVAGFSPWLAFIGLLPAILCASRSAVVALVIFAPLYLYYSVRPKRKHVIALMAACVIIFAIVLSQDNMMSKKIYGLKDTIQSTGGLGARTHWILEADFLMHQLPLTGYGLDTLSEYLTAPKSGGFRLLDYYYQDRTHNMIYDIILMTGWIGYALLLLALGYAVALTWHFRTPHNILCLCVVGSYICYGMFNPHGCLSHMTALTCLLGIRKV